ncbi:hypothetical protein RM530_16820 [Algiphilus sp. W345]|uniref:Uncharacterized protein n=1 Tax=Banduia mediterranea TaxID=3075609 RepID=A0ABU2WMC1_9GAMM|nr:hypothetical protein [Algiphilus sp. W345]MDT0499007.1 hypothetical protein [Algiphilus sp. W345]
MSVAAATRLQQQLPASTVVSVGDREADLYELLLAAQGQPHGARLLVHAERTRRMTQDHDALWDFMQAQPVAGVLALSVPRRATAQARTAQLQVRCTGVRLPRPSRPCARRCA